MTRLLIATLVVAVATRLCADDPVVRFASDDARAADSPAAQYHDLPARPAIRAAERPAEHYDVRFVLSDENDPPPQAQRAFHPVDDCDHRIESLGKWCDCWQPSRWTDEWCDHSCQDSLGTCRLTEDGCWVSDDAFCDILGPPPSDYDGAVRFGYWSVMSSGSPTRIGEFQSLRSSPFVDIDQLFNDGVRSLDLTLSMLDNEANSVRGKYYGPNMSADVRFQNFLRQWDHDPMAAPDVGPPIPPQNPNDVVSDDLNVGQDYAVRVQQLNAKFKGRITDDVSWKLNVWGMRKFGERQANSTGHCFDLNPLPGNANTDNRCHVLSQRQRIDWATMDIQPVIEARFDAATVEYSHTIRTFGQDDDVATRDYTRFGYSPASGVPGAPFIHNFVPENTTHIDRLKVSVDVTDNNKFYANMYHGDTHNEFRDTRRGYNGIDLRWMNQSIDRVTLTGYGSMYDENNQLPPTSFRTAPLGIGENTSPATTLDHPVNYNRTRYGLKGDWKPFQDGGGYDPDSWDPWTTLRLVSGYEYHMISRDFATYTSSTLGTFTQPDTKIHKFEFGPSIKWSPSVNSYVRYKANFAEDPIVGIRESQGRFNTNQPEQEHRIDFGGTWTPTSNFMANAQVSIVNAWNHSFYASNAVGNQPIRFSEDSYPFILSAWYAPTDRLSFTAAYSYASNFVDQDITVGFRGPTSPGSPFETVPWSYQGKNQLLSFSSNYAWTPTVNLVGGVEWDRGANFFDAPPMTDQVILSAGPPVVLGGPSDWSQLPSYSAVRVSTVRLTAGFDWQPRRNWTLYSRYIYFDWNDLSQGVYTGQSHMVLAGASLLW